MPFLCNWCPENSRAAAHYSMSWNHDNGEPTGAIDGLCLTHAHEAIKDGHEVWDMEEGRWANKQELAELAELYKSEERGQGLDSTSTELSM